MDTVVVMSCFFLVKLAGYQSMSRQTNQRYFFGLSFFKVKSMDITLDKEGWYVILSH